MSAAGPPDTRPFAVFEWLVALRNLRGRRSRHFVSAIAFFSFLGIMLGVATLIVVMSVMNGFRTELLDKIIGINGHMFLQPVERPLTDFDDVVTRVAKVPGVTIVMPIVESPAGVSSPFNQSGALVRGVRESDLKRLPGIGGNVKLGTLDGFDQAGGVAIGQRLADILGLRIGDKLTILTAKGAQTPFGVAPRVKSYPVVAIFQIGMSEFDSTFVYLPLAEAQLFFNKEGEATLIEGFVTTPDDMDAIRERIDAAMGRPMILTDWTERNKTYFDALNVERNVMFMILTMIVIVAALNIISGLIMLVKDKSPDIAILRTMGATRGAIMRIFLITGTVIGTVGIFAGFWLGLAFAKNVENIRQFLNWLMSTDFFPSELYFLSRLPSTVDARDVAAIVVTAFILAVLATLYPSWRAANLDPVEALRYE
ncbi:MAG: lipoprotein-releasing ABC transporter permease subunit [Methylobacteriaceae bacterium]|nr:lipoprotein-releasing ABC transporter permease subunit [Methylobacteriaceae bacterium]